VNNAEYRVRRATIEDLPALQYLWQMLGLPAAELQNRLTEFQLVVNQQDGVLGGVGFHCAGHEGQIHSEVFSDFGFADHLRPLLWERVQMLALNHSVSRVWTQETAPFYTHNGFQAASVTDVSQLPAEWQALPGRWLWLRLREDFSPQQVEAQMEILMAPERAQTEALAHRAKLVKNLATFLAVLLALFVVGAAIYMVTKNPAAFGR
jgi:N-acetylglutamate synthase-like GNAT family acetyltransferase